ncbi:MAG: benzoyl-CoA reductase subunit C [Bdellovibrionales bacterium RBG_16_40_8]|nr:MAG: benzoyl-CoA reductase subunit C [Bdellovibrionales bacterium RBG_16_40_8]
MELQKIVERCTDLYRDLDLKYVQEWKSKNSAHAIGYMPVYVPRELIHAAGILPVGIMGGGDETEIIRGDAYFQSYICRIPRSTIELGVLKKLACLDGMLFPAICDVIRNLSGMWKIMFPEVYVRYMDLPQDFHGAGHSFYRRDLEELKHDLEKISGRKITDDRLRQSIAAYNENREVIEALYTLRAEMPHLVPTHEVYLLLRVSNILEVNEHTKLMRSYMKVAKESNRPFRDCVRVVVSGAFCEQPPLNLVRGLESSGCYIVDDDWVLGARYNLKSIETAGDPMDALVKSYMHDTVSTASRYEQGNKKGKYLIELVKKRRAQGVIFAAPSFCDPALLERPMLQAVLTEEGIPHTGFKYAENTGQIQVIKEETGTFADSIKLWGTV